MNNAVYSSLGVSPASVIFGLHRFGEGTLFTETPEPLRHLPPIGLDGENVTTTKHRIRRSDGTFG